MVIEPALAGSPFLIHIAPTNPAKNRSIASMMPTLFTIGLPLHLRMDINNHPPTPAIALNRIIFHFFGATACLMASRRVAASKGLKNSPRQPVWRAAARV